MGEKPEDDQEQPSNFRKKALRWLRDQNIILAIKKKEREIREFEENEAALKKGTAAKPDITNIRLKLMRDLEAMKPHQDEKTYDFVEKCSLFLLMVKEKEIIDENIPQGALEFFRSHPLKAKHTDKDLEQAFEKGEREGAEAQKVVDAAALEARVKELTSFDAQLKTVEEWHKGGWVFTMKDLDEMGFFDWQIQRDKSLPKVAAPSTNQTSSETTHTGHSNPEIRTAIDKQNFGIGAAGDSVTAKVTMDGCTQLVKFDVRGPPGITGRYCSQPVPNTSSLVKGQVTMDISASAPLGKNVVTFAASDPNGSTGSTSYYLYVV
jgi:hypothetical protein